MEATTVGVIAAAVAAAGLGAGLAWRRRGGAAPPASAPSASRRATLQAALGATRRKLSERIEMALGRPARPVDAVLRDIEEALIGADVGARTAAALLDRVRGALGADADGAAIRESLAAEMERALSGPPAPVPATRPWVVLLTGVNGVGKTTTIGKLAAGHAAAGRRVLLVAGDTFRAAAIEQLEVWARRTGAMLVRHAQGASPAAVVYDGMKAATARGVDVVLVDSAGRLHTQENLMGELEKIRRVMAREVPGAPHETLLVLDATTGQNAVTQARTFAKTAGVTGVVMTKLDGTARGGVLLAVRREIDVPIQYLGVGEGVDDLRPFDAREFVAALLQPPTPGDASNRVAERGPEA